MKYFALVVLAVIAGFTVLAPWISPFDPNGIDMTRRLAGPDAVHWFGTDHLGRDVFSRILHGGRVTLLLAFLATGATLLIGLVIGLISGYFGGLVDDGAQGFVMLFQGLPSLSFMLAIAGTLGPGATSLFIAVVVTSWADFSRMVRAETLKLREEPYIEAARAFGGGHFFVLFRHLLPNLSGPITILFTVRVGRTVLAIAALSFLGLGLQPPQADWGVMINDSRPYFRSHPLLMILPGLCILLLSLATNLLGDALRDRLDTRMERGLVPS